MPTARQVAVQELVQWVNYPQGYEDDCCSWFPSGFVGVNAGNPAMSSDPALSSGTLRYWAAAREAAGTPEEPYCASSLAQALDSAVARHGGPDGPLARVLARCAFVVDGAPASRRDPATVELTDGGTIEVLPPFAGGSC
jgi:sulfur-carrier protein